METHKKGIGYKLGLHIIIPIIYFGSLLIGLILKYI